ncbi:MAG: HAD-IA family hydrolase, partial [Cetobacterium sp.]
KGTILDFVEEKVKEKCSESIFSNIELQNFIKNEWGKTWKPNPEMENIVTKLTEKGIKVYPSSNLDKINKLNYCRKNYFKNFSDDDFFSCEMEVCKPDEKYYDKVLESLKKKDPNFYSYEVLLIDDKKENIEAAKSKNIETILFKNVELLEKKLIEKEILSK